MNSKLHAVCDERGRPLVLMLTEGQVNDHRGAAALFEAVVRLGFALATRSARRCLLMDEWFLAGDAAFMDKARARLEDMVRGAEIVVLSSHPAEVTLDWCSRVIWMEQGRIVADGAAKDVLEHHLGHPVREAV